MSQIVQMKNITFNDEVFENYKTGTIIDKLLCSYEGLPRGVNYMAIGDPGVGKTTIIMDMLANIQQLHPALKILFISAEMNEIDLAIYVKRYPKFQHLNILFIESDITNDSHNWKNIVDILEEGWDVVAIDSFNELQGIIKEEEDIRQKEAESMLLSLIKRHNKGINKSKMNSTFITIQQVTKAGAFVGSNRLKHMITAMMELRLENAKNSFSPRFITFSKHRRGDVGIKLFFNLNATGDVHFDEERYALDQRIRATQAEVSSEIRDFADEFDKLFNSQIL
ncbi:MAG: hypothetical protein ACRC9X_00150 [Bacteroidales bacterium]